MIRGKKNFIPQTALVFGFGLLYKLDENSVFRHQDERKVKSSEEEQESQLNEMDTEFEDVKIEETEEDDKDEGERAESVAASKLEPIDETESEFPDTGFKMKLVANIEFVQICLTFYLIKSVCGLSFFLQAKRSRQRS
jgi:hypothetical protein